MNLQIATREDLDSLNLVGARLRPSAAEAAAIVLLARTKGCILERDGLTIATIDTALTICYPAGFDCDPDLASLTLDKIVENSADPLLRPLFIGALPFDLTRPSELSIGAITLIAAVGSPPEAIYVAAPADLDSLMARDLTGEIAEESSSATSPDQFSLASSHTHQDFQSLITAALNEIEHGSFEKVVLAREVTITANRPFLIRELLARLRALHPSCLSFSLHGFLGATPELLIRRRGSTIESTPLAGTIGRSGDLEEDRRLSDTLLHSAKDRAEHAFVVDAVLNTLAPITMPMETVITPHLLELRNVVHLATTIRLQLRDQKLSSLEIARLLHPTPAVAGTPLAAALAYLLVHEGFDRDRYAGLVGFCRSNGDGEWWLGIRSAILDGTVARIFAGVGIVRGSDPAAELAETQLKLQAMLAVLVRP